ncbi:MAG: hypothetical protein ABSD49_08965 [Candidatus Bathyarchaeia archaeon]
MYLLRLPVGFTKAAQQSTNELSLGNYAVRAAVLSPSAFVSSDDSANSSSKQQAIHNIHINRYNDIFPNDYYLRTILDRQRTPSAFHPPPLVGIDI